MSQIFFFVDTHENVSAMNSKLFKKNNNINYIQLS